MPRPRSGRRTRADTTPQPALALIRLAQGDVRAAASGIDNALAEQALDRWARARLLPTQVEVALADGAIPKARAAADELASIVSGYPSPATTAAVHIAFGRVLDAEGDHMAATRELRAAIRGWQDVGAPNEVARGRLALSRALRMQGAADDAALELRAAIDAFRDLGAGPDLAVAERESVAAAERSGQAVTVQHDVHVHRHRRLDDPRGSVGDEVWSSVLRWHDETLRDLVSRGHGRVVKSTGDGLFGAFGSARDALATAIAIQRALRDHRRASGYPARVRIGLHTGEATERGADYGGLAVHVAARVAALAGADEIVVSSAVLAAADDVPASDTRSVALKGVSEPVTVATLAWT